MLSRGHWVWEAKALLLNLQTLWWAGGRGTGSPPEHMATYLGWSCVWPVLVKLAVIVTSVTLEDFLPLRGSHFPTHKREGSVMMLPTP